MGWQPSASKTEILLLCPRPFDPSIETEPDLPGEPARYGSAFHDIIADCLRGPKKTPLERSAKYPRLVDRIAKRHDVKDAGAELAAHVKASTTVLRKWLAKEKLEVKVIEKAYAVQAKANGSWRTREIKPHDEDHRYAVRPDELPMTVDLIAESSNRKRKVIIDHKTGYIEDWFAADETVGFARPTTVPQLRTLGLIGDPMQADTEVGIFHADRKGLPIVYAEPFEEDAQKQHAKELHAAFSRVGQGFLRPGSYCRRCPAREGCPARSAALLVESAEVLTAAANKIVREPIDPSALYVLPTEPPEPGLLETRAGALYDMLKRFRELEKTGTAELRRLVKAGAIIETRDGKVLRIREQTFETLSKKSVIAALGKVAGERELERLRKKGAINESVREQLIADE